MGSAKQSSETEFPLVSVVIPTWNRRDILSKTLTQVRKQAYPNYEVVVVDNASSDETARMVEEAFPDVVLIRLHENMGIEGMNAGFRASKGEFLMGLDDDSFPAEQSTINQIVREFQADTRLGIVACNVIDYESGRSELEHIWGIRAETPKDVHVFHGCGVGIRRSVFDTVGHYPEHFFLYYTESDLCIRAINAGFAVRFHPDIRVCHLAAPSRNPRQNRTLYYVLRNGLWFGWKYLPFWQSIDYTIGIILFLGLSAWREGHAAMYIRAIVDAFSKLTWVLSKRQSLQPQALHMTPLYTRDAFTRVVSQRLHFRGR